MQIPQNGETPGRDPEGFNGIQNSGADSIDRDPGAPAFDGEVVAEFLEWLGERTVALTSFDAPTTGRQTPHATRIFHLPADLKVAVAWARDQNEKERNVYFTANEVRADFTGKKPSKGDIIKAHFAWADADPKCSPNEPDRYAEERAKVMESAPARAEAMGASACISSGNGVQVFLRYATPRQLVPGEADSKPYTRDQLIDSYESMTRRFAHAFDEDAKVDAVQNIDRLMRLPGTVNYADKVKLARGYPRKTQSSALFISDKTWTPKELRERFPPLPDAPRVAAKAKFDEDKTPLDEAEQLALEERIDLLRQTDVFLAARLEGRGVGLGDESRSGLDMSLMSMLKARGLPYREARYVVVALAQGAGAEKAKAGDERYFERMWARTGSGGVSVEEVKCAIAQQVVDAIPDALPTDVWARILYDAWLDPTERNAVFDYMVEELKIGPRAPIKAAWKEFFRQTSESYREAREKDRTTLVAGKRERIVWNPLDYNGVLPAIERAMCADRSAPDLLRLDHAYVRVVVDEMPGTDHPDNDRLPEEKRLPSPKQVQTVPHDRTSMLLRAEQSVCLLGKTKKGLVPMEIPDNLPQLLLHLPEKQAPRVQGLLQHPAMTPGGRMITEEGYDPGSGLYAHFGGMALPEVKASPTKDDAVAAAKRVRDLFLSETMLKDREVDGATTIASLLTGVGRKLMPQAPTVLISATIQGTGKTTLARQMHVVLTGRDMAVQLISPDANEFAKQTLATLIRGPAMVCYDNLKDGSTLDLAGLAPIVTNRTFDGRVLGASVNVSVPTNTLFVFTGNAIKVGSDHVRRVIKIDLQATEARPEQHRYSHADPVRHAQEVRAEVLHALLTMQRAWFVAGEKEEGPSYGFGEPFDRLVTWPLAYAGEEGLFEKTRDVSEQSPEEQAKTAALVTLARAYEAEEFTSNDVVRRMGGGSDFQPGDPKDAALRDAIEATDRRRVHSAAVLGLFLSTLVDQPPREGLILRSRCKDGRTRYRVEPSGGSGS